MKIDGVPLIGNAFHQQATYVNVKKVSFLIPSSTFVKTLTNAYLAMTVIATQLVSIQEAASAVFVIQATLVTVKPAFRVVVRNQTAPRVIISCVYRLRP